jgi:hypothetical protein
MKLLINKKYLLTTDNWFMAPNGSMCNAVFGTVTAIESDSGTLGIATNRHSTNWYVIIGNMAIAGCQLHYAIQTNSCTKNNFVREVETDGQIFQCAEATSRIYFTD